MALQEVSSRLIGRNALPSYLHRKLDLPFVWGENDCVLFIAEWVHIATGVDHTPALGRWTDEQSAAECIAKRGTLQDCCNAFLKPINPLTAQNGDIGMIARTLFIFSGPHIVGPGPTGLVYVDRMRAKCAWSLF